MGRLLGTLPNSSVFAAIKNYLYKMAEEAAQDAARKAYEDALRSFEAQNNNNINGSPSNNLFQTTDSEEAYYGVSMEEQASMMLMEGLQQDIAQDHSGYSEQEMQRHQQELNEMDNLLIQEWMGLPGLMGADEATAQQLLFMMEQRRQEQQFSSTDVATFVRPERHYLTISQDGTFLSCSPLG